MKRSTIASRYNSMKKLADNIRTFRQLRHLTHEQMANQLSMSPKNFARLESGRIPVPMDTVCEISKVLGICPEALIHVDSEKTDPKPAREAKSTFQDILLEVTLDQRVSKIEAKLDELYTLIISLVQVVNVMQNINSTQDKPGV
jgi:transcriptional regulator with XRE-family HTH domain